MKHGHLPLCLSPYHPDLKCIKLVWREITVKVAHQNNGSSSLQQKEKPLRKYFSEYSPPEMLIIRNKDRGKIF